MTVPATYVRVAAALAGLACVGLALSEVVHALMVGEQHVTVVVADVAEYVLLTALAWHAYAYGSTGLRSVWRRLVKSNTFRAAVAAWAALVGWNYMTIHNDAPRTAGWWLDLSFGTVLWLASASLWLLVFAVRHQNRN